MLFSWLIYESLSHDIMKKIAKKLISLVSITLLLVQSLATPFLVSPVYAATSPWTQTDWSGGVGSSTTNQYSSASSTDPTTTAGQITLATPEELTNGTFATGSEGGAADSWSVAAVPSSGWVEVPGNSTYSTTNFLAMQYEAKYDCTATPDGNGDTAATCSAPADSGAGLDYRDIVGFSTSRVVSTANGAPIVHITQTQAISACPTGHLITNNEWMTIARNAEAQTTNWANGTVGSTVASGGGLKRGNVGIADSASYNGADPEQGTGRDTKARLSLSNNATLWDISGNVWEWTNNTIQRKDQPVAWNGTTDDATGFNWSDFASGGGLTRYLHNYKVGSPLQIDNVQPSNASYTAAHGVGRIYHYSDPADVNTTIYAFIRGGPWVDGAHAGAFTLLLDNAPSVQYYSIGFRCASDPVAISQSFSSSSGRSAGGGDTITIGSIADGKLYQSVNVGDTSSYSMSAYVKCSAGCTGGVVDNTVASLYFGGNTISNATYAEVVGETGWYRLTGTVTGVASAVDTGLLVKTGKTVIVDDVSLHQYSASGSLTSNIFDTEFASGAAWGTLTYTATTPGSTSVTVKARTSNSATMTGAPDFSTCNAVTSASDISTNNCVTDSHRYIQYQLGEATTDPLVTPTFQDISIAFAAYDADAPSISLTALSPDPTNDNTPALSGTATDAIGTVTAVQFQMDSTAGSWTACTAGDGAFDEASEAFTCTVTSALSDGSHTMNVRATDSNGNTTANGSVTTDTFTVDVTAPTTPGTPSTTSPTSDTTPTWTWTASTDATSGLAATPYTVEWSQSSSFASGVSASTSATNSFTHVTPLTDGTWYFRVKATDAAGNDSANSSNGSVQINTGAPTGTVSINSGAGYTNSRSVTLTLTASSGFFSSTDDIQMKISNLADLSDASYEAFASTKSWTLLSGDSTKTVYVQFKDSTSNESGAYTDTIVLDMTAPNSFDLQDPGSNAYTNSDRPTFKWKAASTLDATSGLSKYKLEADNGESGDFTVDDIPVSRTTDYETNNYVIHYENFSDSDNTNNYISVWTKSSLLWGTDKNDGKLKEGKRNWKVIAYDNAGNTKDEGRTLFVDRSGPGTTITQINDQQFTTNNFSTTDKTPTIFGKITDTLSGDSTSDSEQVRNDNKVVSGPKSVEVQLEKKNADGTYTLDTITNVSLNETYWSKDGTKITDNSQNTSDKYSTFEYASSAALALGNYRITIKGKDTAGNTGGETVLYLSVTTYGAIATPEDIQEVEKVVDEVIEKEFPEATDKQKEEITEEATRDLEVTRAEKPKQPSFFEKAGEGMVKTGSNIVRIFGNFIAYIGQVGQQGWKALAEGAKHPRQLASRLSEWMSYTTTSFGEIVLDDKPTQIADVKIEELNPTSVIITWKTNHLATSKVNYGLTKDFGKDVQTSKKVHDHKLEITGLTPGTLYYYEVMSQNKNYVFDANHEFTTPEK